MTSSHLLQFENVGKRFGDQWVFRNLTLDLPAGQTVAIVGESGSGKTTLLQLVNGVHRSDEGEILVLGEPVPETNLHLFRRRLGYAVQGGGLFPHMTVFQNATLLARLERWEEDRYETRFEELMALTGLDSDLRDRYPYQLSGGQQHRVSLCRALMLEPDVLLLDEPFSAIDPMTRSEIHEAFIRLQEQEKVSSLLVTHDIREAVGLSQYLVIMANGTVIQHDTTNQVIANPESSYVSPLLDAHL